MRSPQLYYYLILLLISALSACGGGSSGAPTTPPANSPSPSAIPSTEPNSTPNPSPEVSALPTPSAQPSPVAGAERLSNDSCIPPEPVITDGTMSTEAAFPNLPAISAAMGMEQARNDSSFWFIAARSGRIYAFNNQTNANSHRLVLDFSNKVSTFFEMGFTGLAFHPNYPRDNRIFVLYNHAQEAGRSTLSQYTVNTTTQIVDPDSEVVLLTLDQPGGNHNGGDLAFGLDNMLYASFGDGGHSQNDGNRNYAQQNTNLLGAIIRIDVSTTPYTIPSDNPFNQSQSRCNSSANATGQTCPEIFAYGFRNPWHFSVDLHTGDLWVGDVGESTFEEVARVGSGENHGWPIMEGNRCTQSSCDSSLVRPISQYGRSDGQSVVGGYVYRGTKYPNLMGKYIFGDVYSNRYFTVDNNAQNNAIPTAAFTSPYSAYTLAQGNDGEVYLLNAQPEGNGDTIFAITGGGSASYAMPSALSQTGCFNTQSKTSPDGVFDYSINTPLWSDGAEKRRSMALPNNSYIDVLNDGDLDFPQNTVLIKHFLHQQRFIETRLFIHHPTGWAGYSYEWNDSETEAVLINSAKTKAIDTYTHIFPSQAQCSTCHTRAAKHSLGLELGQLNKHSDILGNNIIDYLSAAGYFSQIQNSQQATSFYALDNTTASLEQRARSYLHSNCSGCHRPGAPSGFMDLRFSTPLAEMNICDHPATTGDLGALNAQRLTPGDPSTSVLSLRMNSTNSNERMPTIGSAVIDTQAVELINQWITQIAACE